MRSPSSSRIWFGSKGSIIRCSATMRRIQRSDLMTHRGQSFDDDLGEALGPGSPWPRDSAAATLRAMSRNGRRSRPSGSLTVGRRRRRRRGCRVEQGKPSTRTSCPPPFATAARAEDVLLVPHFEAHVGAHVLDHAENRHLHLLEHLEALARVEQGDVLGRGDDDGAATGIFAPASAACRRCPAAGRRAGSRAAPVGVLQELLERLGTIGPRQIIGVSSSMR